MRDIFDSSKPKNTGRVYPNPIELETRHSTNKIYTIIYLDVGLRNTNVAYDVIIRSEVCTFNLQQAYTRDNQLILILIALIHSLYLKAYNKRHSNSISRPLDVATCQHVFCSHVVRVQCRIL